MTCTKCHGLDKTQKELYEATVWWSDIDKKADEDLTKYQHWNGKIRYMRWSFWD